MLKNLRAYLIGVVFGVTGLATAASIPLFSGPQDPGSLFRYLNTAIAAMNAQVFSMLAMNNATEPGELVLTGPESFVTSGGKVFLVTVDSTGTARYIVTQTSTP